jgi:DNA-binding transcriptional ArsR family regulator
MQVKREFRDRDGAQVAVLDALVDRHEEGMTVLGLRSRTDLDIDAIEEALSELKSAGLIRVEKEAGQIIIYPHGRVIPDPEDEDPDPSPLEWLRGKLPF